MLYRFSASHFHRADQKNTLFFSCYFSMFLVAKAKVQRRQKNTGSCGRRVQPPVVECCFTCGQSPLSEDQSTAYSSALGPREERHHPGLTILWWPGYRSPASVSFKGLRFSTFFGGKGGVWKTTRLPLKSHKKRGVERHHPSK